MCDVCESRGEDYKFLNGDKDMLREVHLYQVLIGKVVSITLCRVHDIELFKVGERRFLNIHPTVLPIIREKAS